MCKYCNKLVTDKLDSSYLKMQIFGTELKIDYDAYSCDSAFDEVIDIVFCPMCGEKLKTLGELEEADEKRISQIKFVEVEINGVLFIKPTKYTTHNDLRTAETRNVYKSFHYNKEVFANSKAEAAELLAKEGIIINPKKMTCIVNRSELRDFLRTLI